MNRKRGLDEGLSAAAPSLLLPLIACWRCCPPPPRLAGVRAG